MALWSRAGPNGQCDPIGFPVVVSGHWPEQPEERTALRLRDPIFGAPRQELVFIGVGLRADLFRDRLQERLMTAGELAAGESTWRLLPDPFPAWPLVDPVPSTDAMAHVVLCGFWPLVDPVPSTDAMTHVVLCGFWPLATAEAAHVLLVDHPHLRPCTTCRRAPAY